MATKETQRGAEVSQQEAVQSTFDACKQHFEQADAATGKPDKTLTKAEYTSFQLSIVKVVYVFLNAFVR